MMSGTLLIEAFYDKTTFTFSYLLMDTASHAAAIIDTSVLISTSMLPVKRKACAIVGSVWPTLSVPGITRSSTELRNFQIEVVVANEPMPSVSKKLVTNPMSSSAIVGAARPGPAEAGGFVAVIQRIASSRPLATSAPSSNTTSVTP